MNGGVAEEEVDGRSEDCCSHVAESPNHRPFHRTTSASDGDLVEALTSVATEKTTNIATATAEPSLSPCSSSGAAESKPPPVVASSDRILSRLGLSRKQQSTPNLTRTKLYNSLSTLEKKGKLWSTFYRDGDENVKKVLEAVASDHSIVTDPEDKRKRRTIVIERNELQKFGFTVQTYVFQRCGSSELKQVSYVDYVELNSPASHAGLRAGDVIVSINGQNVRELEHKALISLIAIQLVIRVVVLFEDCVKKIDLCSRAIKLEKLLTDKDFEKRLLELQEERLLKGVPPILSSDERAALSRYWSSISDTPSFYCRQPALLTSSSSEDYSRQTSSSDCGGGGLGAGAVFRIAPSPTLEDDDDASPAIEIVRF